MIENVVFDMDGVIFDTERLYSRAWHIVGPAYGLSDINTYINRCVGRNAADIRDYILSKNNMGFDADQLALDIRKKIQDIIGCEGLPLKPGVIELLDWLCAHGRKTALATSSSEGVADGYLESSGLKSYFDFIVTGDMITRGKPSPDIYLLACDKLKTPPYRCFAIEDSPTGIQSAYAAGMKPILVPDFVDIPIETEKLAYIKLGSLHEVCHYFKNL